MLKDILVTVYPLVLVSFSCTGPLVGGILVQSALGRPSFSAFPARSMAFAIPFTFLAFFPEKLKSLPKSGNWMNVIKSIWVFLKYISYYLIQFSLIFCAYYIYSHFNYLGSNNFYYVFVFNRIYKTSWKLY